MGSSFSVRLFVDSTQELDELLVLLETRNGAPVGQLDKPGFCFFVDAGESGYGAHTADREWYAPQTYVAHLRQEGN